MIALRKYNPSIYDIGNLLETKGRQLSPVNVSLILKKEWFTRLPRRRDEKRPDEKRPTPRAVVNVRQLDLTPRQGHNNFGRLFLFIPILTANFDKMNIRVPCLGEKGSTSFWMNIVWCYLEKLTWESCLYIQVA